MRVFFVFHIISYVLLQNKIHHKMQREKLYNLQRIVYFNCVLFVLKKKQNSVGPVFAVAKKSFFSTQTRNFLFLISYFYHLIRFIKKEIYHNIQREKLYNLHSKAYCDCFQKKQNSVWPIFARSKSGRSKFCPFWKQKVQL